MAVRVEENSDLSVEPGRLVGPASSSPAENTSLGSKVLGGSFWTVVRFGAANVIRLITNIILTRMLLPEAFGLMALVSALMTGLAMFSDMGIVAGVVHNKRGDDSTFLNTAWTLQVIRGGVLWCFAALLSDAMAMVYSKPELRALILATGLTTVIAGFNSISLLRMRRNLEIRKLAVIDTVGQLLAGVATVASAWVWPSAWALVWGGLIGGLCKLAISHLAAGEDRCRFAWEPAARKELFGFGKWIFASTMLFFLAGQSDRLIFGKLLSVSTLGVFSIAVTLALIPTQIVWQIGNSVLFPALSRRNQSADGLRRVYHRAVRPLLALGVLPAACLAAAGPEVIEILYDPRYSEAGWMIQLLAIGAWLQVPQASSGAVVLAMGEPRWLALANGMKFLGMVILLPLGYHFFGAPGAIGGLVGAELFRYSTLVLAVRRFGLPSLGIDLSFTTLALAAAAAGLIAGRLIAGQGGEVIARLIGIVAAVTLIWGTVIALIFRKELSRFLGRLPIPGSHEGHSNV